MPSDIKHFLDEDTLYILEAPYMLSRKRSGGKDFRCLIRLTKHDAKQYRKYEKMLIIHQWLNLLGKDYEWVKGEFSEWWDIGNKISNKKSYWWEWKDVNKESFTYLSPDNRGDEIREKCREYSGRHDNWRSIQGDEKSRVLKRHNILDRAYKSLTWIKLCEDMGERGW